MNLWCDAESRYPQRRINKSNKIITIFIKEERNGNHNNDNEKTLFKKGDHLLSNVQPDFEHVVAGRAGASCTSTEWGEKWNYHG